MFLLAINPILDYLQSQQRHGFSFRKNKLITLAYADDLTLICSNQRTSQRLLNDINAKFEAIDLHLKPAKCKTLSIVNGTAKDVRFSINNQHLDNIKGNKFKFLGSTIFSDHQEQKVESLVYSILTECMTAIDNCPLRGSYKCKLYMLHVVPKLRFQLTVHNFTSAALKRMDGAITKFVRKWLRLPSSTNIDFAYHSKGLALKIPSFLYDHGHIVCESNQKDNLVKAAIKERTEHPGLCRTSHSAFLTSERKY